MHVHPVLRWTLKLQQPQLPRSEPDGQPTESPQLGRPNQEFVTQNTVQQTDQSLHLKGAQSVASWSLFLAGLVVGITVCVAIGYIVFLQPNPHSNVPALPPYYTAVLTRPDDTSSTQNRPES